MKTIHLLSATLLSLLCACSGEVDTPDALGLGTPRAVSIAQVSLAGSNPVAASSRASTTVAHGNFRLGVFRLATSGYTALHNVPYSYNGSNSGRWESTTPIILGKIPALLLAYYPYHPATGLYARLASSTTYRLAAQPYSEAEDICFHISKEVANNGAAAPTVAFTNMDHVYSRLRLELTRGKASETTGRYDITSIHLSNGSKGFIVGGKHTIVSNDFSPDAATAGGWNYRPDAPITLAPGATAPVVDLLIPRQAVDQGLTITFTIDGLKREVTIAGTEFGTAPFLAAGTQYTIGLTLRDVGITATTTGTGVTTEGWVNTSFLMDKPGAGTGYLPYITVRAAGLKVAKGNLMRANGTGAWYLAPDQGFYTAQNSGGDYFCWGSVNPTSFKDVGASMAGVNAGCEAVLGKGWRVPTRGDFERLVASGYVWADYATQGKTAKGYYFGTTKVPDSGMHKDTYLFLPGTTHRYADNGVMYDQDRGYYWGSDLVSGTVPVLDFTSSGIKVGSATALNYGNCIRCVSNY